MNSGRTRVIPVLRIDGQRREQRTDRVAVEAPLTIELDSTVVATTLRTPGEDRALALGLLWTEAMIRSLEDVVSIEVEHAEVDLVRVGTRGRRGNVPRRLGLLTSACGACGKVGLDELIASVGTVPSRRPVRLGHIEAAFTTLRARQACFDETGGVHAAALFDDAGACLASAEDVGRHNAVDKVVGALLEGAGLGVAALLVVSGRTSFEIVHKAVAAGIACVAGVSAPSALAVSLADRAGVTLLGFVRGASMNVYTHPDGLDLLNA